MFGTFNYDFPGAGTEECPASGEIDAEFSDRDNSVEIERLQIKLPSFIPIFGFHQLEVDDAPATRTRGTWNPVTGVWSGAREDLRFEIREVDEETCIKGELVCEGELGMEFSGTTLFGMEGPIPGATGPVWVDAVTDVRMVTTVCGGAWEFLLPDADLRIDANPTDPVHGSDPGAEFR